MRIAVLLVAVVVSSAISARAQSFHPRTYVYGGHWVYWKMPGQQMGVYLADLKGATPTIRRLVWNGQPITSFAMDADNRGIVLTQGVSQYWTYGIPQSGAILRLDPVSGVMATIRGGGIFTSVRWQHYTGLHVTQDGDYLVMRTRYIAGSMQSPQHHLLRVDRTGRFASTVGTPQSWLGQDLASFDNHKIGVDVDTGHWLVGVHSLGAAGHSDTIFEVTSQGKARPWCQPRARFSPVELSMTLNHRSGHFDAPLMGHTPSSSTLTVSRLRRGGGVTTLQVFKSPMTPYVTSVDAFEWDLQTAQRPRMIGIGGRMSGGVNSVFLYTIDPLNWAYTETRVLTGLYHRSRDFAFYRGRHTQTEILSAREWKVRFSAPDHPGKVYVAAVGLSGVRPGIPLQDGRRINLKLDPLVALTLKGAVPGVWNPGPGRLDANGEAEGLISFRPVYPFAGPVWIVWAVLDPTAPCGIAYLPDTYVLRV
jgi:hypothetical protein